MHNLDDKGLTYTITAVKGEGGPFTIWVDKGDEKSVKVPWTSEEDTWKLTVKDDYRGDVKVGDLKKCHRDKDDFDLHAVCKPDEHHVRLAIRNDSAEDEKFKLKKKGDDSPVTGTAKAGEHTFVTVKWDSPEDTWILHIDDQWIKEKVDSPKACEKKPTEKPTLPVTGVSSATWMGIGLGMLGVGAAALLFVAYRARRLGD